MRLITKFPPAMRATCQARATGEGGEGVRCRPKSRSPISVATLMTLIALRSSRIADGIAIICDHTSLTDNSKMRPSSRGVEVRTQRALRTLFRMLFAVTTFLMITGAEAGSYTVTHGQQYRVCTDLAANLNRHPEWPPLACGVRVDIVDPRFGLPRWESLDVRKNLTIIRQLQADLRAPNSPIGAEEEERMFQERLAAGVISLGRSVFDINHDGKTETVYRYLGAECDSSNPLNFDAPAVPTLYAVGKDGKLLGPTFKSLMAPPQDVFFYRGRAYTTWWLGRHKAGVRGGEKTSATLGVYETEAPLSDSVYAKPVCTLLYHE